MSTLLVSTLCVGEMHLLAHHPDLFAELRPLFARESVRMDQSITDTTAVPSQPLHRHQSSLEGILEFSSRPPLNPTQRQTAACQFIRLVDHFNSTPPPGDNYDRVQLVRLTYEYARSEESKENFLRAFFESIGHPLHEENNEISIDLSNPDDRLLNSIRSFADYLFENFFLPREQLNSSHCSWRFLRLINCLSILQ